MNEARIEELKNALRAIIQMVQDRGAPLSDEMKTLLAQVMEHVASRIQQLRAEEIPGRQPPAPPTQPPIDQAMPSSNIEGFSYDPKNQRLYVRFLGKHPNRFGPIYSYDAVPPQVFKMFREGAVPARSNGQNKWGRWWKGKVPSMGASLYTLLKTQGYPYQRVS